MTIPPRPTRPEAPRLSRRRFAANVALAWLVAAPLWLLLLGLGMRLAGRDSSGAGAGPPGFVAALLRSWLMFGGPVFLAGGVLYEGILAAVGARRPEGESRAAAWALSPLLLALAVLAILPRALRGRLPWGPVGWGIFLVAGLTAALVHAAVLRRPLRPSRRTSESLPAPGA